MYLSSFCTPDSMVRSCSSTMLSNSQTDTWGGMMTCILQMLTWMLREGCQRGDRRPWACVLPGNTVKQIWAPETCGHRDFKRFILDLSTAKVSFTHSAPYKVTQLLRKRKDKSTLYSLTCEAGKLHQHRLWDAERPLFELSSTTFVKWEW